MLMKLHSQKNLTLRLVYEASLQAMTGYQHERAPGPANPASLKDLLETLRTAHLVQCPTSPFKAPRLHLLS